MEYRKQTFEVTEVRPLDAQERKTKKKPPTKRRCRVCKGEGTLDFSRMRDCNTGKFKGRISVTCRECKGDGWIPIVNAITAPKTAPTPATLLVQQCDGYTHGVDFIDDIVDASVKYVLSIGSAHGPRRRYAIKRLSEVLGRNITLYQDEAIPSILEEVRKQLNKIK